MGQFESSRLPGVALVASTPPSNSRCGVVNVEEGEPLLFPHRNFSSNSSASQPKLCLILCLEPLYLLDQIVIFFNLSSCLSFYFNDYFEPSPCRCRTLPLQIARSRIQLSSSMSTRLLLLLAWYVSGSATFRCSLQASRCGNMPLDPRFFRRMTGRKSGSTSKTQAPEPRFQAPFS